MENHNNYPYHFNSNNCKTCGGKCCRGIGGYVWISMEELEKMAETRKIDVALFSKRYIRQAEGRMSLQDRVINGEHFCCFFDFIDCKCSIYQSRPKQCKSFPFWNQFKKNPDELFVACPGVSLKEANKS